MSLNSTTSIITRSLKVLLGEDCNESSSEGNPRSNLIRNSVLDGVDTIPKDVNINCTSATSLVNMSIDPNLSKSSSPKDSLHDNTFVLTAPKGENLDLLCNVNSGEIPISQKKSDSDLFNASFSGIGFHLDDSLPKSPSHNSGANTTNPLFTCGITTSTSTQQNHSQTQTQTHTPSLEDKVDKILWLQLSNAKNVDFLNEKLSTLEFNTSSTMNKLSRRVEITENKLESDTLALNEKLDGAFTYVDERIDSFTEIFKSANLDKRFQSAFEYTDTQIGLIKEDLSAQQSNLNGICESFPKLFDEHLQKKKFDLGNDSVFAKRMVEISNAVTCEQLRDVRNELLACKEKQTNLEVALGEIKETLNYLSDPNVIKPGSTPTPDARIQDKKIEKLSAWSGKMQTQLNANTAQIETLDTLRRKNNLIMDGFVETKHEDLKSEVIAFLTHFVPYFHAGWLAITYRLGKVSEGSQARKVFLGFTTLEAKELVFLQAGAIAKAGSPGNRIFINEDISEICKRKRADVRK